MSDQIKQIAERLQGLRDVLELTPDEVAKSCQLSVEEYLGMESGEKDISVSALQKIARKYGIALDVLMFGEEPKMSCYFLTRCGSGVSVERTKAYKYQSLASGFRGRKADPFIVTVEPKPENTPIHFNSHEGQEFNLVIEGRMGHQPFYWFDLMWCIVLQILVADVLQINYLQHKGLLYLSAVSWCILFE